MGNGQKKLLFSIANKDFEVQTFKAGGPGGQHQNKTNSGVRIIHKASGARGESRSERSQQQNKKLAFRRLTIFKQFKNWLRLEVSARMKGHADAKAQVEEMLHGDNLKIEIVDESGKWIKA